jgi:hypothetical protein
MTTVKMTREQKADKLTNLWNVHESAVAQRLEARDREALDKLAKALGISKHVRVALDWAYTRTMIGSGELGQTASVRAMDQAYAAAKDYVKFCIDAVRTSGVYEYSECRRAIFRLDGACAGYLFAAKERIGA